MEEVLIDLYNRAQTKGYKKPLEDFTSVLYTNDNVLQDMYGYVQSKGYTKSLNDFENLIGKKKTKSAFKQPLKSIWYYLRRMVHWNHQRM